VKERVKNPFVLSFGANAPVLNENQVERLGFARPDQRRTLDSGPPLPFYL
jgi:hypothetical protein